MDTLHSLFHQIASGIQLLGLVLVVVGGLRIVRAPLLAARRSAVVAKPQVDAEPAGPGPLRSALEGDRYARGLTDFYRIQGGIALLVGIIFLLVPIFAS
jgi:uncharacterized membrane protein HdeD (DUF308 family)